MNFIRKYSKLIIFILVCLTIFYIFKNNNNHNINYTSLGDSFALGENAYEQIDYGYSDYLKDYLIKEDRLNKYIKSFSKKDASINSLYQDITLNKKIILKNKTINIKQTLRESNIITISIGLNDLIYQLSITEKLTEHSLNRIISNIEIEFNQLITEIRKYYPNDIYIIGYYNIYPESTLYEKAIKKLNQVYQKNDNVIYIDTYKLFQNNKNYLPNFINYHPNHQGYEAISKQIITKIAKNLEK